MRKKPAPKMRRALFPRERTLYAILVAAAENGERCPGTLALNERLPDSGTDPAVDIIRQLVGIGAIRIVRSRPFRVIEIVETGKRTSEADIVATAPRHHGPHKADGYTKRTCLSCSKPFQSAGTHNRICIPCKGSRFDGLPANMVGA